MNTLCRCGLFPTTGFVSAHERARTWFDAFAIESAIKLPSVTESHVYSPSESISLIQRIYRRCIIDTAATAPGGRRVLKANQRPQVVYKIHSL